MESAKFTIKEVPQIIQELDFGEGICSISCYIQKRMQNNDISKIINVERPDMPLAVCSFLRHFQPPTASVKRKFFRTAKTLGQGQTL